MILGLWPDRRCRECGLLFPVRLTDQPLSCAAKARVPKPTRRTACLHVSRAMQAARRRSDLVSRGGSAAGPKPGRVRCYLELGARLGVTKRLNGAGVVPIALAEAALFGMS